MSYCRATITGKAKKINEFVLDFRKIKSRIKE